MEFLTRSATTASTARIDAALQDPYRVHAGMATDLAPSRTIAAASTVAVLVPSPAASAAFGGYFAHHLSAHILELVLKLDFLGDGDAVLGDAGGAKRLVEHDVAAFWAERDLHRIVENFDAVQHPVAGIDAEFDFFD